MSDELIGKTLGGYEILDRIDQGGMATVYRARQTSMNRIVALKILPRHFMRDDTYLRRFEREVEIIAQLEHRNIVPVYDYGEHDSQPYIAMRYMPAGSVDDMIKEGAIPVERVMDIIQQVAPALDYAHTKNVLHRDLKPSNILMDDNGDAYITDFGIARILGVETKGTTITTQGVVGTPSYMSPEQAQGKELDGRSDVYSLGVMLFEMLTGRRPFENETPYGIAVMQVTAQPPSLRTFNGKLTAAIEQVVLKSLKKNPDNRYGKAVELAQAFKLAVERPDSVHDTEPSGISIKPALEATQPSAVPKPNEQNTVPSSASHARVNSAPVSTPPPVYAPPPSYTPPPSGQVRPLTDASGRFKRISQKRSNIWISVLMGMVIGCSLLSLLVAAVIITLDNLFDSVSGDDSSNTSSELSPAELTGEAARLTLVPGSVGLGNDPDATPVFSNATPIPSRTPTTEPTEGVAPVGVRGDDAAEQLGQNPTQIIYFADREGNYDIFLYDLQTNEETRLTETEDTESYPLASPDGTRIVYQSDSDGDFEIYVMRLSDGNVTQLTNNNVLDRLPSWSADGEWIVYSSDTRDDGNYDLYRIQPDGSNREVIYSDGQRNSHARFSPDGRHLVFTTGESGDATTWEIAQFDLRNGEVTLLTDNVVRDSSPVYSPDGETIVYITEGEGNGAIAVINADVGSSTVIYDEAAYEWGASYSPDGELIIFNAEVSGQSDLLIISENGDLIREIRDINAFYPSWLP